MKEIAITERILPRRPLLVERATAARTVVVARSVDPKRIYAEELRYRVKALRQACGLDSEPPRHVSEVVRQWTAVYFRPMLQRRPRRKRLPPIFRPRKRLKLPR